MNKIDMIFMHLKKGKSITSIQAFQLYNVTRLAAFVFELRKKGYSIETQLKNNGKANYAVYKMEKL